MEFSGKIKVKMEGLKATVTVDTDLDGQPVFTGTIDLPEAVAEGLGLFKKTEQLSEKPAE
jgi:hypothetical protein